VLFSILRSSNHGSTLVEILGYEVLCAGQMVEQKRSRADQLILVAGCFEVVQSGPTGAGLRLRLRFVFRISLNASSVIRYDIVLSFSGQIMA
jgi:hypothetical protein